MMESKKDRKEKFREILNTIKKKGYKLTRQRKYIIDVFLDMGGHVSAEEIFDEIRKKRKDSQLAGQIGFATVYRTLKMLKKLGLVTERDFGEGKTRYEVVSEHHDHLICKSCGFTVEFFDREIENRQNIIAKKYGFSLISHRHELIGLCPKCRKAKL